MAIYLVGNLNGNIQAYIYISIPSRIKYNECQKYKIIN